VGWQLLKICDALQAIDGEENAHRWSPYIPALKLDFIHHVVVCAKKTAKMLNTGDSVKIA
jgi:hypothetical protein